MIHIIYDICMNWSICTRILTRFQYRKRLLRMFNPLFLLLFFYQYFILFILFFIIFSLPEVHTSKAHPRISLHLCVWRCRQSRQVYGPWCCTESRSVASCYNADKWIGGSGAVALLAVFPCRGILCTLETTLSPLSLWQLMSLCWLARKLSVPKMP